MLTCYVFATNQCRKNCLAIYSDNKLKKYLEREDIRKAVSFKVVHCRLIGLGDQKSNIETLMENEIIGIQHSEFEVDATNVSS